MVMCFKVLIINENLKRSTITILENNLVKFWLNSVERDLKNKTSIVHSTVRFYTYRTESLGLHETHHPFISSPKMITVTLSNSLLLSCGIGKVKFYVLLQP